ncbi:MAG: lysophospholipid acyltransferase family protein [bacterium]|nr:lysophospholipid acyltransferase family protein [bacterium]
MKIDDRLEYGGYLALSRLVRSVPRSTGKRIAAAAARRYFDQRGKRVRWALTNLRIAFPERSEAERETIGRESYANFGRNMVDFVHSEYWSDAEVEQNCRFVGMEHVEAALSRGKGAILLTQHLGAFEVGTQAASIALREHGSAVVGRPMANQRIYERLKRTRTRAGTQLIDRNKAGMQILRALRKNQGVGVLLDQYSRRSRGVFVPFFGVRCSTSAGIATLGLRAKAAIIPLYVLPDGPDRHRTTALPELEFELSGDRKRDIEHVTARCNECMEALIRQNPEQWMWGHRRFRHSPDIENVEALYK